MMNVMHSYIYGAKFKIRSEIIEDLSMTNSKVEFGIRPDHLLFSQTEPTSIIINNAKPLVANIPLHGDLRTTQRKIIVSLLKVQETNEINHEMSFEVHCENIHLFCFTNGRWL